MYVGMSLHDGVPGTLGWLVPFGISYLQQLGSLENSPAGIVTDLDRLPCVERMKIDPTPSNLGM